VSADGEHNLLGNSDTSLFPKDVHGQSTWPFLSEVLLNIHTIVFITSCALMYVVMEVGECSSVELKCHHEVAVPYSVVSHSCLIPRQYVLLYHGWNVIITV
jgi:hypothetical protein